MAARAGFLAAAQAAAVRQLRVAWQAVAARGAVA
jgi:hypothetical protein